jgi:hypothetical protein
MFSGIPHLPLASLLFNISVNDLYVKIHFSDLLLFADGLNILMIYWCMTVDGLCIGEWIY